MKQKFFLLVLGLFVLGMVRAQTVINKVDTTVKMGKAGYKVNCKNKGLTENMLSIRPVGFESTAHEMNFLLKGRVFQTQIDDLNGDGYPDLVLFIYTDTSATIGTVYAFLSDANKDITPCLLPDVMLNGKVNTGYKGHDKFSLLEGNLLQKFPIYKQGDSKDHPTGGTRVLLYQLVKNAGENGGFKFDLIRYYDAADAN